MNFATRHPLSLLRGRLDRAWFPLLALLGALTQAASPSLPPSPSAEERGRGLALELRREPPALNTTGTLRRRDADGQWLRPLTVRLDVRGTPEAWESRYLISSVGGGTVETLRILHVLDGPNTYFWESSAARTNQGAEAQAQALNGNDASLPLAGSDFWLCDLGLEFLHWPAQRVIRTEMRKGRNCRVLESLNPSPAAGHYAKVLSWIDIEKGGLLRAEAFGADGRRLKEFNIGSFKKVGGRWQLKSMEIRNARDDTRTRLEFDLEIEE